MRKLSIGKRYTATFVAILVGSAALTSIALSPGPAATPTTASSVAALARETSATPTGPDLPSEVATGVTPTDSPSPSPTDTTTEPPTPSPAASPSPTASPMRTPTPTRRPTPKPTKKPTPKPTPRPTAAPAALPYLLASIGDSYSEAFNVAPGHSYDHPEHSWVVGNASGDGVYSVYERLRALGRTPGVVDAATSGRKMSDAARQARLVVSGASGMAAGEAVLVTFELGTNDLCDSTKTASTTFESQYRSAMSILRAGLPRGSRILVLSVPDFDHFRAISLAYWGSRTAGNNSCAPFLGNGGRYTLAQARSYRTAYNASLKRVCDSIQANDGKTGRLYCRYNAALLSESNFASADLSSVDHFHPSMSGQAKMAASAWRASWWASLTPPAGGG